MNFSQSLCLEAECLWDYFEKWCGVNNSFETEKSSVNFLIKYSENLAFQHECSSTFQGIAAGKEQLTTAHVSLYRSLRNYLNCTVICKESTTQRTRIPNSLTLHSFKGWIDWPRKCRCISWLQLQIFLSAFFLTPAIFKSTFRWPNARNLQQCCDCLEGALCWNEQSFLDS